MDNKVQKIHLQELQDKVISYRTNTFLKDVMKETYTQELKQLLNVEMDIVQTQLIMPDPKMCPPKIATETMDSCEEVKTKIEDCNSFLLAMQLLK